MKTQRKEAIRQYKEAKVPRGIYSFRCARSGMTWVGPSRNLPASHNSLLFSLRGGLHRTKELQQEWNEYGEDAFDFLVLETFENDLSPLLLNDMLKARANYWATELNSQRLL